MEVVAEPLYKYGGIGVTATVIEFCRAYGINEKSENVVGEIYDALIGGGKYRQPCGHEREGQENETPISDGD